jgi:hypothetical protein
MDISRDHESIGYFSNKRGSDIPIVLRSGSTRGSHLQDLSIIEKSTIESFTASPQSKRVRGEPCWTAIKESAKSGDDSSGGTA